MSNLKQQLPPLNLLVAFEAAVRCGSFTRAGEDVGLSQASVSRQIRQLEQCLGLPLFKRGRYDVTPNEYGTALAETVREALGDIARTTSRLRAAARGEGTLTIFSDLGVAGVLIAPCVGEFQRRYPELDLRVLTSAEPIETVEQDFDFGLQHGRWAEERYHIEPIADDVLFPVCAPALAADLPNHCTPEDLAAQPLLQLSQAGRD